eukprot:Nitzschia sp. Nitz4//scaffold61_size107673//8561//9703//NITZ4_004221-RA/size107673-processed-gene-0.49-mRNA-1//1//CDS//3329555668//6737//frame0
MKIVGYIARRRCIGKNLAFADIHVIDETTTSLEPEDQPINSTTVSTNQVDFDKPAGTIIQVVFQRDSEVWNKDLDHTFPHKNAKLPYGGKVEVDVRCNDFNQNEERKREPSFLVHEWSLLDNPREEALATAQEPGTSGISCTKYLKSRGDAFLRFNKELQRTNARKAHSEPTSSRKQEKEVTAQEGEFPHGDNRAKALRANIFASWLIATYGEEYLKQGVLDIAGGKGKLSIELSLQGKVQSTIVDPLVRKHGSKLEPRDAKRIRKAEAPHPGLVAKPFNQTTFVEECETILQEASVCVGLHPDECTEDIVDVALRFNKPFAIVPCCVFSGFFPLRTLADGKPVRTYEELLEYLLAKDERLRQQVLPFEGRNVVIYLPLE